MTLRCSMLIGGMMLFVACNHSITESCEDDHDKMVTTIVTPEMARAEVEKILEELDVPTRTGQKRTIGEMHILGGFGETRANDNQPEEPLVYLFNFDNEEGYALIAGDKRVVPVLAFAEKGNIDPEKGIDNPGLIMFLSNADIYYRAKVGLPITDNDGNEVYYNPNDPANPIPVNELEGLLKLDAVLADEWHTWGWTGDVIPCKWNQTSPFNKYCFTTDGQDAYAGCVAIAVAQIMFHYQKSTTYNGTYYDWDYMKTVTDRYNGTDYAKDMVAKLIYQLGRPQNLNMTYGAYDSAGSGAAIANIPRTFVNFGYTSGGTRRAYDHMYLCDGPLLVTGYAKKKTIQHKFLGIKTWSETSYHEGHAWVIDQSISQSQKLYTMQGDYLRTDNRRLLHCNWGWGGQDDGYYFDGAFNTVEGPEDPTRADTIWEGISRYYAYNLEMIAGIEP